MSFLFTQPIEKELPRDKLLCLKNKNVRWRITEEELTRCIHLKNRLSSITNAVDMSDFSYHEIAIIIYALKQAWENIYLDDLYILKLLDIKYPIEKISINPLEKRLNDIEEYMKKPFCRVSHCHNKVLKGKLCVNHVCADEWCESRVDEDKFCEFHKS